MSTQVQILPLTGLAGKHDERAAARQKDRKRGQVGIYVVLVDAGLVEPHQRLLTTVCGAQLLGPHLQLRVLGVAVILPGVRDESIHCAQLGRLRANEHLGVRVAGKIWLALGLGSGLGLNGLGLGLGLNWANHSC